MPLCMEVIRAWGKLMKGLNGCHRLCYHLGHERREYGHVEPCASPEEGA